MSDRYGEAERLVAMEDRYLGIEWYKAAKGQMRRLLARIAELEKEAEKLDCLVSDLDRALRELVDADDELPTEYLADEMNDARRLLGRDVK